MMVNSIVYTGSLLFYIAVFWALGYLAIQTYKQNKTSPVEDKLMTGDYVYSVVVQEAGHILYFDPTDSTCLVRFEDTYRELWVSAPNLRIIKT
jgi:hypothetical protein